MKNKFKKISVKVIMLLIIIAFSFSVVDSTAFARGKGTTKSSSTKRSVTKSTTKSTPKSGAKSGSFSNTKPSSSKPTNPTTSSSRSRVSSGNSWHVPTIIFWPHRTIYYDSYGASHYRYGSPSLIGGLVDVIVFLAIIAFVIWLIKKRK